MDRLIENLIIEAKAAGLQLQLEGRLLKIAGPRKAGAIAKELLNRKAEVEEYLETSIPKAPVPDQEAGPETESAERIFTAGTCPVCTGALDLQARSPQVWWCSGCRRWFDQDGGPLRSAQRQRPHTDRDGEAEQLLKDLKAAGCSIYVTSDDELRITNIARISTALMIRLDSAGAEFRRIAITDLQNREGGL